jgi:hypothetical protein
MPHALSLKERVQGFAKAAAQAMFYVALFAYFLS